MTIETIKVGSIVKPKLFSTISGYYRVRSIRGAYANLCSPFGRDIIHKRIPLLNLVECEDEWYAKWRQTEQYQCM